MDLDKSRYLIAIAELKSFSKAAESCYVSQPAMTRYIKGLENELGVKLFDRSSSPVQLTYAGERYVDGIRRILDLKERLDQEMLEIASRKKDRLMIGMHATRSYTWLPRILPAFRQEQPNVEVKLLEGNYIELQQALAKEIIDVFFIGTSPKTDEGLEFIPLCREQMALVVSRTHPLMKRLDIYL